ncbi:uncharacterized protein METZ01_LOCUS26557 [marine metagenome]|uniref:Enoyl reductase (ER) domain-containing protein n=1 Tax=marine metagenome TaxID=408172 RepID=A0A381Q7U3_9ZZZZ
MKLVQLEKFGDQGLIFTERGKPSPCLGEVIVKIKAASVNYRDFLIAHGFYNPNLSLPLIPLSDGAGEVVEVGNDVKSFQPGDRVCSMLFQNWHNYSQSWTKSRSISTGCDAAGVLTEYAVLPESALVKMPGNLNFAEASTLPCAAVTAWACLQTADIQKGDTVVLMGTGGVSIFGLQFAKALGANVIITSSSDEKLKRAEILGADGLINYKENTDWGRQAFELSGGGAKLIIEIGGAGTLVQSMEALGVGGHICSIGVIKGGNIEINLFQIMFKNIHLHGITVGPREIQQQMNEFIVQHDIHPVIDREFDFEESPSAIMGIKAGNHFGKIVINMDT